MFGYDPSVAHRLPINVRLESFEGPLDLLLYLIQSHELDITRVSISRITDQYLAYVRLMQELDFDVASQFLVMAATLLLWKSKSLLPQESSGLAAANAEDELALSQEELIRRLREHQRFQEAGQELASLPLLGQDVFTRPNLKPPIERIWKEMELTELALLYQDVLARSRKRKQVLRKETVSIAERMAEFGERLQVGRPTALAEILSSEPERPELVVTFLASLELGRLKKLRLHQEKTYEMIYVELVESLAGFNFSLAEGFEGEMEKAIAAGRTNDQTAAI